MCYQIFLTFQYLWAILALELAFLVLFLVFQQKRHGAASFVAVLAFQRIVGGMDLVVVFPSQVRRVEHQRAQGTPVLALIVTHLPVLPIDGTLVKFSSVLG